MMVAPVTEKVTAMLSEPKVPAVPVPVVSTETAAVLPKLMPHPPPAVASVPWDEKVPVTHAVEEVATPEIKR